MGKKRTMHLVESKFTVEEVCDVLTRFGGLVYPSARHLQVSRGALVRYIDRHPEAQKAMEAGREQTIDQAESILLLIIEGSLQGCTPRDRMEAAKMLLLSFDRGRKRGYGEKVIQEVDTKQPIILKVDEDDLKG